MTEELKSTLGVEKNLSVERHEVPEWVATDLNLCRTDIAQLEVTCTATTLYDALTKYFAQRGVDVDTKPPTHADRIHSNPLEDRREYPGKLTSIQNPPPKFRDRWRLFSQKVEDDDEEAKLRVTYAIGYGWGKVRTNPNKDNTTIGDQIVVFQHYARGEPVEEWPTLSVYRQVVLYATSDAIIKTLVREALAWYHNREKIVLAAGEGRYVLYTLKVSCQDRPPEWICHGHRPSRPVSSIVLAPGVQEAMMDDARTFFNSKTKRWYYSHGVPYRRNYLLYGPPGTGKTSMIRALAGDQKLKACFMSLSHKNFGDHTLIQALADIPKPCVIVFEDVDALFDGRNNSSQSQLTFSGLLNAVDGMVSTEGTLIMMTTNHMDKLDPALLRCGRIDRRFEFELPGREEIGRYYSTFYPDAPAELPGRFADAVIARKEKAARSLATLQQHFIYTRGESAEAALEKVDEFFESHFPQESPEDKNKVDGNGWGIPIIGRFFQPKPRSNQLLITNH